MGSVSAGGEGLDLNAVVQGGEPFVKRVRDFQAAATAYQKALDDLNLGKSAVEANNAAHRLLNEAKAKRAEDLANLEKEMADARATMEAWKQNLQVDTNKAHESAVAKEREATSKLAEAEVTLKRAQEQLRNSQKEAQAIELDAKHKADSAVETTKKQIAELAAETKSLNAKAKLDAEAAEKAKAESERILAAVQAALKK
jgi:hypothetical protein